MVSQILDPGPKAVSHYGWRDRPPSTAIATQTSADTIASRTLKDEHRTNRRNPSQSRQSYRPASTHQAHMQDYRGLLPTKPFEMVPDWLRWVVYLAVSLIIACALDRRSQVHLPRIGADPGILRWKVWYARYQFFKHGSKYTTESYQKYKHGACKMQTMMSDYVVVGPKYLEQLRNLPETQLSASAALVDSVLGQYNGVDINLKDNLNGDMVRGPFTRMLPEIVPSLLDELNLTFSQSLPQEPGHAVTLNAYKFMYRTINEITSRVFVGAPICREEGWRTAVEELPRNVFAVMGTLFFFPDFIRPLIAPWLPAKRRLATNLSCIKNLLYPDGKLVEFKQDQVTAFQLLAQASKNNDTQLGLSQRILLLTAAALHTSCTQLVHAMFDLCAMREYFAPLRAEAEQALAATGGIWTIETVRKLHHMDSFLKESQRLRPTNLLGFGRKVMSPIHLPDTNIILPTGTILRAASTEMAHDPEFHENPNVFDGNRFLAERTDVKQREKEFTGIEPGNVAWGTGRFTCPGRWYAATMLKLVLGKLRVEFDFEFPSGQREVPAYKTVDTRVMPNQEQEIVFTRLSGV